VPNNKKTVSITIVYLLNYQVLSVDCWLNPLTNADWSVWFTFN